MVRGAPNAKTTRPSAGNVLPRERLFATLDAARRAPLLWVHGPPGCGKTSLVSSYLDARASNGPRVPLAICTAGAFDGLKSAKPRLT